MPRRATSVQERVWRFVTKGDPDECWLWQGGKSHNGYGMIGVLGGTRRAHRVIWEIENGPVPEGMELDHLCRTPACVNPLHLEPVTRQENALRTIPSNSLKTHCPAGHPYDGTNLYVDRRTGWRQCMTCRREHQRALRARRRQG